MSRARPPIEQVSVVIPAADEQETIGGALAAVAIAADRLRAQRPAVRVAVVVVLDACTDGTADLVAAARVDGSAVHTVTVVARSVGVARAAGSTAALLIGDERPERHWTAHTDADSSVPPHWLVDQVAAADAGADLVLGTVQPLLEAAELLRWTAAHQLGDGHRHVHGANLGIRASALIELGGWQSVTSDEDVHLVEAAVAAGLVVHRSGSIAVRTSGRTQGRSPGGMSAYLSDLLLPSPSLSDARTDPADA